MHFERRSARKSIRNAFAYTVVRSLFQGINSWRVVELDVNCWAAHLRLGLAATSIAHIANPDLLGTEFEVLTRDLDGIRVGGNVGNPEDLGESTGIVFYLDFHVEWCHAFQIDRYTLLLVLF